MQFKITFRNQYKALDFTLFLLLFTVACILYFKYTDPYFNLEIFVWIFLALLIPVLYLHIEYLLINSNSFLKINSDLSSLHYVESNKVIDLDFNQTERIILYLVPSAYRSPIERKMHFLPIESYGYAVIYSKEGDKIIITSLMIPDLYEEFSKIKGITLVKKKRFLASPSLEKLIQWFSKDGL